GGHAARVATDDSPPPFEVLTPEQAEEIEAIAAQIIPSDGTPGAREARVVHFFDRALGGFAKDMHDPLVQGLADLRVTVVGTYPGVRRFAALDDAKQKEILRRVEKTPFFEMIRGGTIAGMFAIPDRGGNYNKIGWNLLG